MDRADLATGLVLDIRTNICRWTSYGIALAELLTEVSPAKHLQADLGSAMPTSGGLYWWTHFFSSPATRNPLCFLVGYSNTLGLVGGLCSIDCRFPDTFFAALAWEEGNIDNEMDSETFLYLIFFDIHCKLIYSWTND